MKPTNDHMCDFCFMDKINLIQVSQHSLRTQERYNSKTDKYIYEDIVDIRDPMICFECLRTFNE